MRWFIVFLIVANVILFFWVQQESRPLPGEARLPPPDVGRLRLLSENREASTPGARVEQGQVAEESVVSEAVVAEPNAVQSSEEPELPGSSAGEDQLAEVAQGPGAEDAAQAATGAEDSRSDPDDTVLTADQEGAAEQLMDAGQDQVAVPEVAAQTAPEAVSAPQPTAEVQAACARVGPLPPADADALIAGLPPNLSLLSDVVEEFKQVERYYVIIPPQESVAAGQKMMKQLADAGVSDTWLFRSGEYRNGISLGFFSREAGAKRRAAAVAQKGFTTEIKEQASVREGRWLLLKNQDGDDPGQSLPLGDGIRVEPLPCP